MRPPPFHIMERIDGENSGNDACVRPINGGKRSIVPFMKNFLRVCIISAAQTNNIRERTAKRSFENESDRHCTQNRRTGARGHPEGDPPHPSHTGGRPITYNICTFTEPGAGNYITRKTPEIIEITTIPEASRLRELLFLLNFFYDREHGVSRIIIKSFYNVDVSYYCAAMGRRRFRLNILRSMLMDRVPPYFSARS